MSTYERTKNIMDDMKRMLADAVKLLLTESGLDINWSDLTVEEMTMFKDYMSLLDRTMDLALAQAKANDELADKIDLIDTKLNKLLAANSK